MPALGVKKPALGGLAGQGVGCRVGTGWFTAYRARNSDRSASIFSTRDVSAAIIPRMPSIDIPAVEITCVITDKVSASKTILSPSSR